MGWTYNQRMPFAPPTPSLAPPALVDELRDIVGLDGVLSARSDLVVYECDGFVIEKNCPDVVVFPRSTNDVARIVRAAVRPNVPFVPRGAGPTPARGCLPRGAGV